MAFINTPHRAISRGRHTAISESLEEDTAARQCLGMNFESRAYDIEWICLIKQFNSITSHFLLTKNKKNQLLRLLRQAQRLALWQIFYTSPPKETHSMKQKTPSFKSMAIKWNEGLHESLRQGRASSVKFPPAFQRLFCHFKET